MILPDGAQEVRFDVYDVSGLSNDQLDSIKKQYLRESEILIENYPSYQFLSPTPFSAK